MKKLLAGTAGLIGVAMVVGVVLAAAGDPVQPSITPPGPSGNGCGGIGVAYDGVDIFYTCADEAAIRKTDLSGADKGTLTTQDAAGNPISVDAIAWDPNEGKIWGGEVVDADGVGGNDTCRIYSIDPVSGIATQRFDRTDTGCTFNYFDGLTVDTVTDTLYYSPDVQKYIRHLDKSGSPAANDSIDFETLTSGPDRCPGTEPFPDTDPVAGCNNSGLAIGIDGTLFAGTNGEGLIMQVNPVAKTLLGQFASVSGRDEDMECGPEIDGKETILSRKFEFPGLIDVLEAPEGTCIPPEPRDPNPPKLSCAETVNPHGKTVPPAGKTTLPGPKGGDNEDGFYELLGRDDVDPNVDLYVTDSFGSGPFGPFASGDRVKITEAAGATPSSKPMGSTSGQAGAIAAHITLNSDAIVFATDAAGNKASITCLVPPPPK